jgi:para-nitrobenzyl esterase
MLFRCRRLLMISIVVAGCHAAPLPRPGTPSDGAGSVTVVSEGGPLVGRARGELREFLGIPYAAPPVGALRWRPPAPAAAWRTPRDATRPGHACLQLADGKRDRDSDEDCLVLNVWAPRPAAGERLPVMVWIHGGAFVLGAGSDDLNDGAKLAARAHVIVVTFNYRLGALGFLAHRQLAREAGRAASPSYGLLDQRAALAWVQRNIAAFAGDPGNVTLFGESAGAWSTCAHLVAPGSRGLFARAIIQSGACSNALYFSPPEAEAQGDALAAKLGCAGDDAATLACLRGKSADAVAGALPMKRGFLLPPGVWWGPVVDGVELPRQPIDLLRAGDFARVPLLVGANRDEGTVHTVSFDSVTPAELSGFVAYVFGAAAVAPVLARYQGTPKAALTDVVTDGIFVCQARRIARAFTSAGVPAYLYHFTHPLDDPRVHDLGATHSVDLFFLFGNRSKGFGLTVREQPLGQTMMDAWGAFARHGDPSTPSLPWPRYSSAGGEHMTLDLSSTAGTRLKQETCDFWDELDRR